MARHIIEGYDVSGTSEGAMRPVTYAEYMSIPGVQSNNTFYFITDRNEIRYNTATWGNGDSSDEKRVTILEISWSDYQALPIEQKNADRLHFITDRNVIIYHGRIFGDFEATHDGLEDFIFYRFTQKYAELMERLDALEARL